MLGQVVNELLWGVVERRTGDLDIHSQGFDHVARVSDDRESRDVSEGLLGVERNELAHLHLLHREASSIAKGLREQLEDLSGSLRITHNERIVHPEPETDLD